MAACTFLDAQISQELSIRLQGAGSSAKVVLFVSHCAVSGVDRSDGPQFLNAYHSSLTSGLGYLVLQIEGYHKAVE